MQQADTVPFMDTEVEEELSYRAKQVFFCLHFFELVGSLPKGWQRVVRFRDIGGPMM